jgi:hypothetical protein
VLVEVGQNTSGNAIQEFHVTDNPYNAAYGGAGAGFVNTVTKSGTDLWHGNAFYYNRNSGVGNANDPIDKAAGIPRPLDVLQQFGAGLGGPIVRHSAWFYFDYEQQRRKQPISVVNPGFAPLSDPTQLMTNFGIPNGTVLPTPDAPYPVPQSFSSPPASDDPNFPLYVPQVSNALGAIDRNLVQRKRRADGNLTHCGDGAVDPIAGVPLNQTCDLLPASGFKTLQSINQLNGPRTFQFAFRYRF